MKREFRKKHWPLALGLALPLLLVGLFYLLRDNQAFMSFWVLQLAAPAAQALGRLCSIFPFSLFELLFSAAVLVTAILLVRLVLRLIRSRSWRAAIHSLLKLTAPWLWVLAAFYWLWNAAYYAPTFSQHSGLSDRPHSIQELAVVTDYFAWNAARLAPEVPRDEELHWTLTAEDCIRRSLPIYDNIAKEFPCLDMEPVRPKLFVLSRLQSILGFTGMYSPFTGEANINGDAPVCLIPSTISHELSHQRMISSEAEANFVGIAACITSDDVVYQYSGYLSGLVYLSNALYARVPELWYHITRTRFTPEVRRDWQDNLDYWAQFDSPVELVADRAYDTFLKGNGQVLGMESYGSCIDLLIAYTLPEIMASGQKKSTEG